MTSPTAAAEIRRIHPHGKIVFLSLYEHPGTTVRQWAHAFVSKYDAGTKLIPTLTRLIDGTSPGLTYPWQHLVADAFAEPIPENLPGRINAVERAIAARLIVPGPLPSDERIALKEALQALRKLLAPRENHESGKKEEIA